MIAGIPQPDDGATVTGATVIGATVTGATVTGATVTGDVSNLIDALAKTIPCLAITTYKALVVKV